MPNKIFKLNTIYIIQLAFDWNNTSISDSFFKILNALNPRKTTYFA